MSATEFPHTATMAEHLDQGAKPKSAAIIEFGGQEFMRDARGSLVPLNLVKTQYVIEDDLVRDLLKFAVALNAQIARFKGHTFEDVNAFQSLLEQEYGAKAGGKKGNVSFTTYDGLMQVKVQIADLIEFGPELQTAKVLIDECLVEWGAESHEVIRALVNRIFSVEKAGQINRADLFSLTRLEVKDERWLRAMEAVRAAIRITGQKAYVRFYQRESVEAGWQAVTIDLASA